MTKFKDVANLYMGCRILETLDHNGLTPKRLDDFLKGERDITPILRPLSSMTRDEAHQAVLLDKFYGQHHVFDCEFYRGALCFKVQYEGQRRMWGKSVRISEISAHQFHYLLKQGFDLFGLIESGEASDATKQ